MNENDMKKHMATNLDRFDEMTDEMIDTSDIPPLTDDFFEKATWRMPDTPVEVTIKIEPDVLAWFKAQGEDYQQRLSAALRLYADAHRSFVRESAIG
ncbi:MAG: BrnA antitoxin family protein [Chloroflexota bacterium]